MIKILVSLIPVFLFLVMLLYLDSFKLVRANLLLICLMWGLMSAAISFFLNTWLISRLGISFSSYSSFVAPLTEETLKCSLLWWLVTQNKAGFMIDSAIYGFAIGSAFAFLENLYYLVQFNGNEAHFMTWITRGFGTAIMHGGTVSLFGMIFSGMLNRAIKVVCTTFAALAVAFIFHGLYNHFMSSPVLSTLLILVLVPSLMVIIFSVNEKSIRNWFELEFEVETSMLKMIRKGEFSATKTGAYLVSLKEHFSAGVVVDMYCFISLYLELSMKAKTMMMLREQGLITPPDPEIPDKLVELKTLRKNIGRGGMLAISPVLRVRSKDLWKMELLSHHG